MNTVYLWAPIRRFREHPPGPDYEFWDRRELGRTMGEAKRKAEETAELMGHKEPAPVVRYAKLEVRPCDVGAVEVEEEQGS